MRWPSASFPEPSARRSEGSDRACPAPDGGAGEPPFDLLGPFAGPARAGGEQAGAVGGLGEPGAELADAFRRAARARGPASSACAGSASPRPASRSLPLLLQRLHLAPDLGRPDHRLHARVGGDPPLPAARARRGCRPSVIVPLVGDRDERRRARPSRARSRRRSVRRPGGPGWRRAAARRSAARSSARATGAASSSTSAADQERREPRPAERGARPAPSPRAPSRVAADPPAVDVVAEQRRAAAGPTRAATRTLIAVTTIAVPASETSSVARHHEQRHQHRQEEGRAGEGGGAPGGAAGHPRRLQRRRARRRAPRGSARPSAARSRPPAPGPSSCRRSARSRRSRSRRRRSQSTPREAVTVTAPKASGIAAATGERKTSSRTSSRKGIAISSATFGRADRLVLDRPREAGEARLGRADRGRDPLFEGAVEVGDGVPDRLLGADVEVDQDQGLARPGAQAGDAAAVPGRDRRDRRVGAQRADQRRALRVERRRRAPAAGSRRAPMSPK